MSNTSVYLNFLFVGVGGAIGALSRYGITLALAPFFSTLNKNTNSVATLVVNILGCFLAGVFLGLKAKWDIPLHVSVGISVGFLGGLTTFSAFSVDTVAFLQQDSYVMAITNILLNVVVCLLMVLIGLIITQKMVS